MSSAVAPRTYAVTVTAEMHARMRALSVRTGTTVKDLTMRALVAYLDLVERTGNVSGPE